MNTVTDVTEIDRQGERITCRHSWHYAADGLPRCHDGSEGRRCEGYTVQCGKGHAPCERHADRRAAAVAELARENVESAERQGVGSALVSRFVPPLVVVDRDDADLVFEAVNALYAAETNAGPRRDRLALLLIAAFNARKASI